MPTLVVPPKQLPQRCAKLVIISCSPRCWAQPTQQCWGAQETWHGTAEGPFGEEREDGARHGGEMEGPAQSPCTPSPTCPPPTRSPASFSQSCFPSWGKPCPACPLLKSISFCKHHMPCSHSHPLPAPTALQCTSWRRAHSEKDADAAGLGSVQQSQGLRSHSQTKDPYGLHAPAAGHHRHCLPRCPAPTLPAHRCCSHLPPLPRGSLEHLGCHKAPNWGDACRGRRDMRPCASVW